MRTFLRFKLKARSHCSDNENDNDKDARNAFYWLNERVRTLRGAIQPIECILFASGSFLFSLSLQCDSAFTLMYCNAPDFLGYFYLVCNGSVAQFVCGSQSFVWNQTIAYQPYWNQSVSDKYLDLKLLLQLFSLD